MSDTLRTYRVGIAIDGRPHYQLDVPTAQGQDAAERRARFIVASRHRYIDIARITVIEDETEEVSNP